MKRRFFFALATITGLGSIATVARGNQKEAKPMGLTFDLKLDEASAVKIAEVIFVKIYGERILKEKPWIIKLEADDSIFHIEGTFNKPEGSYGGVGEIKIKRSNAEVVSMMHGK